MHTKTTNIICVLFMMIIFISSCDHAKKVEEKIVPVDNMNIVTQDQYYRQAYQEIVMMLENKMKPDFKRAAFLLEWAYLRGELNYDSFCQDIFDIGTKLKTFIKQRGLEGYKTAGNYALFEFFTKPNWMNGNKPFTYDFNDFLGREDYSKVFITKIIRTHTGQCRSLPMLYKILADEIGTDAYLAQAPNHMYIKHLDENNKWVNIELTNGHFATDPYIISSMAISVEAIRNRIYMDAMSKEENIAFLLYELSIGYIKLFGYDSFILQCCNKSLYYYPHNLPTLTQKYNTLRTIALAYIDKNGKEPDEFLLKNHREFKETYEKIESLGYRNMSRVQYLKWLNEINDEARRTKNKTVICK